MEGSVWVQGICGDCRTIWIGGSDVMKVCIIVFADFGLIAPITHMCNPAYPHY